MSPGFHPKFLFETLLQWTRSNHHKSCQSLSFWRNFSIVIQTSSCPASSQKTISIRWWSQQLSSNFKPHFHLQNSRKKLLLPAFNLTCLLTHCLLLFSLLSGSFILLKLLFLKFTMTSSLQWIVVRSFHSFFSTYLLPLILSIIPSFLHVFKIGSVLMVVSLDWFSSYLSLRSQAVSINDSISAFSTLSCGVPQGFNGFNLLSPGERTLLGAPLLEGSAMNQALEARCSDLNIALDRFPLISAHDGLVILKNSISAPKLMYTLRCSLTFGHCLLDDFDQSLKLGLSRLANVQLDDLNRIQASLPVKDGGLGIRSVGLLAPSAFLASAAATQDLQAQLLPVGCPCDPYLDSALDVWSGRYGSSKPQGTDRSKQRCWDQASVDHGLKVLESHHTNPYHKARLLASRNPDGGHWLHAWPISACGLRLDDEAVRVAIGLRLGILTSAKNMTAPVVSELTEGQPWVVVSSRSSPDT